MVHTIENVFAIGLALIGTLFFLADASRLPEKLSFRCRTFEMDFLIGPIFNSLDNEGTFFLFGLLNKIQKNEPTKMGFIKWFF